MALIPPGWPARSIAECDSLMLAPGQMWEQEDIVIDGVSLKTYKHLPKSIRDVWSSTAVRASPSLSVCVGLHR